MASTLTRPRWLRLTATPHVDTGGMPASIIGSHIASRLGLRIDTEAASLPFVCADGSPQASVGTVRARLRIGGLPATVTLRVAALRPVIDVLLGEPYLNSHRTSLCYGLRSVTARGPADRFIRIPVRMDGPMVDPPVASVRSPPPFGCPGFWPGLGSPVCGGG